jgi:hypothetical protein
VRVDEALASRRLIARWLQAANPAFLVINLTWTVYLGLATLQLNSRHLALDTQKQEGERVSQVLSYRSNFFAHLREYYTLREVQMDLGTTPADSAKYSSMGRQLWAINSELNAIATTIAKLEGKTYTQVFLELARGPSERVPVDTTGLPMVRLKDGKLVLVREGHVMHPLEQRPQKR